jgi:large subunit ribosomal protein L18
MKTIVKRRRRQNKTDYLKRLKLLKSRVPRVVFRRTNKYFIGQYVTSREAQDKIVFGVNSKDLMNYGWPKESEGSLKSITAGYLLGFLMGNKIIEKKLEKPIVDLGMLKTLYKTKVYAFIKGLIDAGIEISCKKEAFPSEDRIKGKHLKKDFSENFEKIKSKIKE